MRHLTSNYISRMVRRNIGNGLSHQPGIYLDQSTSRMLVYYNQLSDVTDGTFMQWTPGTEAVHNILNYIYYTSLTTVLPITSDVDAPDGRVSVKRCWLRFVSGISNHFSGSQKQKDFIQ